TSVVLMFYGSAPSGTYTLSLHDALPIFGANGAGKSSTLRCLAGLVPPSGGKIIYDGQDVTRKAAHDMVAQGVSLVPEGRRLFPELTVYENLRLGAYTGRSRQAFAEDLERVYEYFPRVYERR